MRARARSMWQYTGEERPSFADDPGAGQESVWDYPRPPILVRDTREVLLRAGNVDIARTRNALRLLETASPPTFYIPLAEARTEFLREAPEFAESSCEWKGNARYWSIVGNDFNLPAAAWSYHAPHAPYAQLADHFSVYPGRVECFVDGEAVRSQEGAFYGGWITDEIVGPWKGAPGTSGW
ncbi:MAG: DUF427 domain-containing protein [Gemmatimonadota bacterium]|nr:DUF427 domain-containing protein [Gemmatimonadota bacterium]